MIGYGEVGRILAEDLRARGTAVMAFDIQLAAAASPASDAMRQHARRHGVTLADSHAAAVRKSDLVVSAVTASQAVAVAQACAPGCSAAASSSTSTRRRPARRSSAAQDVNAAGGRYVEGAVMTSVPPYRIKVPLLLGGPDAAALLPMLGDLGFAAKVASDGSAWRRPPRCAAA